MNVKQVIDAIMTALGSSVGSLGLKKKEEDKVLLAVNAALQTAVPDDVAATLVSGHPEIDDAEGKLINQAADNAKAGYMIVRGPRGVQLIDCIAQRLEMLQTVREGRGYMRNGVKTIR